MSYETQRQLAHTMKRLIDASHRPTINDYLAREDPAFQGLIERWTTAVYISQGSGQPIPVDELYRLQRGTELWRWMLPESSS